MLRLVARIQALGDLAESEGKKDLNPKEESQLDPEGHVVKVYYFFYLVLSVGGLLVFSTLGKANVHKGEPPYTSYAGTKQ